MIACCHHEVRLMAYRRISLVFAIFQVMIYYSSDKIQFRSSRDIGLKTTVDQSLLIPRIILAAVAITLMIQANYRSCQTAKAANATMLCLHKMWQSFERRQCLRWFERYLPRALELCKPYFRPQSPHTYISLQQQLCFAQCKRNVSKALNAIVWTLIASRLLCLLLVWCDSCQNKLRRDMVSTE